MTIKAIIFDVDGVLLNTVPYHFRAWKKLFNKAGVRFSLKDYLEKVNGIPRINGLLNIMPRLKNKALLEQLANKKQQYFKDSILKDKPKPLSGIIPLFKKLQKMGLKLSAASSSKNAPLLLRLTKLAPYFSAVVSGNDFKRSKPDPEIFIVASKLLGVSPKNCVVVEDARVGIEAAKNAGMKTIGVLTTNDKTIEGFADITLSSLRAQKRFLDFISGQ